MTTREATVGISAGELRRVKLLLSTTSRSPHHPDVMFQTTAKFEDGKQADIKVVNGDPPFVDPVLFDENGQEMAVVEPDGESFEGDYTWKVGGDLYVVHVVQTHGRSR